MKLAQFYRILLIAGMFGGLIVGLIGIVLPPVMFWGKYLCIGSIICNAKLDQNSFSHCCSREQSW